MPYRFLLTATTCLLTILTNGSTSLGATAGRTPYPGSGPTPSVDVLVDGMARPQYVAGDTRYIEALKNRDYEIRITNPFPVRVAVALAVDGLNTIDATHTTARDARKWVLGPYETVTLSGWQVSRSHARRFRFTTEERSYGQALGKTENLGVISAVFFRERPPVDMVVTDRGRSFPMSRSAEAAPAPAVPAGSNAALAKGRDEYAATGLGQRTEHAVQEVALELEATPAATFNLRYEFRTQLVRLGVLPAERADTPLARRERARGFEGGFCPEPKR